MLKLMLAVVALLAALAATSATGVVTTGPVNARTTSVVTAP